MYQGGPAFTLFKELFPINSGHILDQTEVTALSRFQDRQHILIHLGGAERYRHVSKLHFQLGVLGRGHGPVDMLLTESR